MSLANKFPGKKNYFMYFLILPPHLYTLVYKYSVISIKQVVQDMTKIIKITYF